jgi:hypothetical protein
MMDQLSSPPRSLLLPIYAESVALAQATASTPTHRPKSRKFNPNVEILFHLEASEDNGSIWIVDNIIHHMVDWIGLDWIEYGWFGT